MESQASPRYCISGIEVLPTLNIHHAIPCKIIPRRAMTRTRPSPDISAPYKRGGAGHDVQIITWCHLRAKMAKVVPARNTVADIIALRLLGFPLIRRTTDLARTHTFRDMLLRSELLVSLIPLHRKIVIAYISHNDASPPPQAPKVVSATHNSTLFAQDTPHQTPPPHTSPHRFQMG